MTQVIIIGAGLEILPISAIIESAKFDIIIEESGEITPGMWAGLKKMDNQILQAAEYVQMPVDVEPRPIRILNQRQRRKLKRQQPHG